MSIIDLELKVKEKLTRITNDRAKMYYNTLIGDEYDPELDMRVASLTKLLGDINVSSVPLDVLYRTAKSLGVDAEYVVTEVTVSSKDGARRAETAAVRRLKAQLKPKATVTKLAPISFKSYSRYNPKSGNYELNEGIEGHIYKEANGKKTKYYVGVGEGADKVKLYFSDFNPNKSGSSEIRVKDKDKDKDIAFTVVDDDLGVLLEYIDETEKARKAPAPTLKSAPAPTLKSAPAPTLKSAPAPTLKSAPAPTLKSAPAPTLGTAPAPANPPVKMYKFRSKMFKDLGIKKTFKGVGYPDTPDTDPDNELIDIAMLTKWLLGNYRKPKVIIINLSTIKDVLKELKKEVTSEEHIKIIELINEYQPDQQTDAKLREILVTKPK